MLSTRRATSVQRMPSRPEQPVFDVTVQRAETRAVVVAVGELDVAVASELDGVVRRHLPETSVLLDLAGLSFMDSSGVRILDALLRDADRHGWTLTLRPELQRPVRRLLTITGMIDVVPFDDEDDA